MSLTQITKPCKTRNIIAYDLEWWPGTLQLRLVGVHDGNEYRSYRTTLEFLLYELRPETDGAWYFAHAGGLADFQFLLQDLIDHGFEVKAAFSGSSAIIVSVERDDHMWFLIDSYWLLRSPLKQIGDAVGIKKLRDYVCPGSTLVDGRCDGKGCSHPQPEGDEEPHCIFYAPDAELRTYNEQDCLILWTAINQLQAELHGMGSELCMTQASSAMRLYRRSYLRQEIRTMPILNEIARHAYVGSRVEVYAQRCTSADYYDINSSFPYAMTFPAPGNFKGAASRIPDSSEMFLADVEIEIPETYLPPIPWRHPKEHRVYFPTGKWRSWLSGIDIHLLLSQGGKIHKTHRVLKFEEQMTLASYAEDLYAKRLKSTTAFEKMLYKLLLNSLYGKFGESPLKVAAYIHPSNAQGMKMVSPGVFLSEETMEIEHEHVPISMHITAFARRTLFRFNKMCLDQGGRLYYNDSVSGDRCVVTRDPRGQVRVMPIERLFDRHAGGVDRRFDGKEEGTLEGWEALSRSLETGEEGFFPIAGIIRHKAGKVMHLVSTKEGQTEVTCDHGIMTQGERGLEETSPEDFVSKKREFERVRPVGCVPAATVDLFDELQGVALELSEEKTYFEAQGEVIVRIGKRVKEEESEIRRFYQQGTPELHALLRIVGAFVAEGSASLAGTLTPATARGFDPVVATRHMFSIAQQDEAWLGEAQLDLQVVVPTAHTSIFATSGASVLRSGTALLAFLFAALCGEGHSRNRRLPSFCLNLSKDDFLVLWKKLLEGDGNTHPQGYETYTTISRELASQLSFLLSLHGFDHAITYRPEKKSWMLRLREGKPRPSRTIRHETRQPGEDEFVYDLSVRGGGTFVDGMGCVLLKNTDSAVTTTPPHKLPEGVIGKKLGMMKHEYHVENGTFVAPKIYMLDATDMDVMMKLKKGGLDEKDAKKYSKKAPHLFEALQGKGVSEVDAMELARKDVVRAKGFSRMTVAKFHDIVEGREVSVRRMTRVRELLRTGDLRPREGTYPKKLQITIDDDGAVTFKMRPKRCMLSKENNSRPWRVEELMVGLEADTKHA